MPYHAASRLTNRRAANRIGQRLLAPAIRADLRRLGMHRPILIAGLPNAVDLLPWLPRRGLVYHCADDYAHVAGFPSSLPALEADLCRQANLVITTSETLACNRRARSSIPTRTGFRTAPTSSISRRSPTPRGSLLRCSIRSSALSAVSPNGSISTLLVGLAEARPNGRSSWSVQSASTSQRCSLLDNVKLLGPRPYAALGGYLAAMDVALIPFKRDPVTYHADPIKAYEYLAAGVPVVATDLPALQRLAHVVRLADSPDAFLRADRRRPRSRLGRDAGTPRAPGRSGSPQLDQPLPDAPRASWAKASSAHPDLRSRRAHGRRAGPRDRAGPRAGRRGARRRRLARGAA